MTVEMPSVLLMAAVRNVQIVGSPYQILESKCLYVHLQLTKTSKIFACYQARPTMYQVVKDMIEKLGYTVIQDA